MKFTEWLIVVAIVGILAGLAVKMVAAIGDDDDFMRECRADGYSKFQCERIWWGTPLPPREVKP